MVSSPSPALTTPRHYSNPFLMPHQNHNRNHTSLLPLPHNHPSPLLLPHHSHSHSLTHSIDHPPSLPPVLAALNRNHDLDHPLPQVLADHNHNYNNNHNHPLSLVLADRNHDHNHNRSFSQLVLDDHNHYHSHNHYHNQLLPLELSDHNHSHNHDHDNDQNSNHPLSLVLADHKHEHNQNNTHNHDHNHPLLLELADHNHNRDDDSASALPWPDDGGEGVLDWHELCFEMPSSSHEHEHGDHVIVAGADQDLGGFQFDQDFFLLHDMILSHGEDNSPPFISTRTTTTTTTLLQQEEKDKKVEDGITSSSTWCGTKNGEGCMKSFGEEESLKKRGNGEGLLSTGRARSKRSRFGGFNGVWGSTMLSLHESTILIEEEDDDEEGEDEDSILTDVSSTSNTFCQSEILSISHANSKKEDLPPLKQSNEKTPNMKKEKEQDMEKKKKKKSSLDSSSELMEILDNPFSDPYPCRRCMHCLSEKTPQWRQGPLGPKTLCNACGVRYKSGRLFPEYRPAKSPTFLTHRHSNSHKKVLEMRLQKSAEV